MATVAKRHAGDLARSRHTGGSMFEISNQAMTLLRSALEAEATDDVFRLVLADDALALRVAATEEGDVIYEQGGVAVVAAPRDLIDSLGDQRLDVEETDKGPMLVMAA
jgi:hypothetical protein